MGLYKYISALWKKPHDSEAWKPRLIEWRKAPSTVRIERPTRLDRARSLGYRAKEGIIVVRQRVQRGGHKRERIKAGRRSKRFTMRKNLKMSYQTIAEQRVARKYRNMEVLNSYWVAQDSNYYWYEVIMVDPLHPQIATDSTLKWVAEKQHKARVFRGLTSSAKKSRQD